MINKQLVNSFIQQNVHESWFNSLSSLESLHDAILKVVSLTKTQSIEPKLPEILSVFKHCTLDNLKVIWLLQDPYPHTYANGIALSNYGEIKSPSLKIVNEELTRTHGKLEDPSLISWCRDGILLLNSSLTVETNKIGSHYQIWEQFIIDLIKNLDNNYIWVLSGSRAKSFKSCIPNGTVLTTVHPASDVYNDGKGFRGSNIFLKLDQELLKKGLQVNWTSKIEELV